MYYNPSPDFVIRILTKHLKSLQLDLANEREVLRQAELKLKTLHYVASFSVGATTYSAIGEVWLTIGVVMRGTTLEYHQLLVLN